MVNKTIKRNNKNVKKQKYRLKHKTLKSDNNTNNKIQHKGGSCNTNIKTENFEVRSLNDFDYERYRISKYLNANIDWRTMPGPPPQPDCCIL